MQGPTECPSAHQRQAPTACREGCVEGLLLLQEHSAVQKQQCLTDLRELSIWLMPYPDAEGPGRRPGLDGDSLAAEATNGTRAAHRGCGTLRPAMGTHFLRQIAVARLSP